MGQVNLEIQSLDDYEGGKKLFESLKGMPISTGTVSHVGILEGGMASGKVSLMIVTKFKDGTFAIGEIGGEMFDMVAAALTGARARFSGDRRGHSK